MIATGERHRVEHHTPEGGPEGKRARRLAKAEARIRLQETLPPEPFDRFRIVTECISEARQVVDLSDHRARYALVIIGVLNAGVFALISRAHLLEPTNEAFGRPVVWSHPAYANKCVFVRNDKEIICASLAK